MFELVEHFSLDFNQSGSPGQPETVHSGQCSSYCSRFNIAPGQMILAVVGQTCRPVALRWGFVPHWMERVQPVRHPINARAETLASSPMFRDSFRNRRCLIVADGFYEWKKDGRLRLPYHIGLNDQSPFTMAGVWDCWQANDGSRVYGCAIVTRPAITAILPVHERMPLILSRDVCHLWLDPGYAIDPLDEALVVSSGQVQVQAVSCLVNSPHAEGPECRMAQSPETPGGQGELFGAC